GDLHCYIRQRWKSRAAWKGSTAAWETRKVRSRPDLIKPPGGPQGGADGPPVQGRPEPILHICRGKCRTKEHSPTPEARGGRGWGVAAPPRRCLRQHSCNCRFSDSTSSESALSRATSASILRTACSTVV